VDREEKRMRYLKLLGLLAVVAAMTVFVPSTAATPSAKAKPLSHVQPGPYSGVTSQGHGIAFNVVEGGANDFIDNWSVGFNLTCNQTGRQFGVGHGFGGFNVPIDPTNHTFKFTYDGAFYFYFAWSGTFTSDSTAQGTAHVNWGGIYNKRRAEVCASGQATWQAAHTTAPGKLDASKYDVVYTATRGANGKFKVKRVK
jgi:hypothetical protein